VDAMGIDYNFSITPENFETGIKRSLKNKEILIVHAHLMDSSNGDYTINPEYLEKLFLICKKHHVKSVTTSEIYYQFKK
jgi:hypothetical protein